MSSGFSFGSVSASASSSLPENLGVGSAYKADATSGAAIKLSAKDQQELDENLVIVKQLLGTDKGVLNPKDIEKLNQFTKDLIERPDKDDTCKVLASMQKNTPKANEPPLVDDDYSINAFSMLINIMRKGHVELHTISEKLKHKAPLTYAECNLLDKIADWSRFANAMVVKGKVADNDYIKEVRELTSFANANAFKDFQDGDVLFYDLAGREHYYGSGPGVLEDITMGALGTNYCHAGIFYRTAEGEPWVAEIQGKYVRHPLKFGHMSFIKGKRTDPAKFTAAKMLEADRLEAQKKIGKLFATTVSPEANLKIGITMGQQINCVFSHTTSEPNTQLGKVKLKDNVSLLCSELAGIGLMEAFHKYNEELRASKDKDNALILANPFSEYENLSRLHPERLLNHFGPHQGNERIISGWEDVPSSEIYAILPQLPRFPDLSYPPPPKPAAK